MLKCCHVGCRELHRLREHWQSRAPQQRPETPGRTLTPAHGRSAPSPRPSAAEAQPQGWPPRGKPPVPGRWLSLRAAPRQEADSALQEGACRGRGPCGGSCSPRCRVAKGEQLYRHVCCCCSRERYTHTLTWFSTQREAQLACQPRAV